MTTVQDLGRRGYARYGVSRSGAADWLALRMANALVGNKGDAAVLEVAMGGVRFRCVQACSIALTGADCQAVLTREGLDAPLHLKVNESMTLKEKDVVELGYPLDGIRACEYIVS
jgi:allophanate hydrolase subunit 2